MKKVILALVSSLLFSLPAFSTPQEEGMVDLVRGQARVLGFDGTTRPAVEGDFLVSGEIVETGPDGFVRLVMADGSELEVSAGSRIEVFDSRANPSGGQVVVLFLGRIFSSVMSRDEEDEAFTVATPTAVCGVRGTDFTTGVGMEGSTRVGVDRGEVEVSTESGAVKVEGGMETMVEQGEAPTAPANYQSGEERWREWALERQDRLIRYGNRIVPLMFKDVKRTRSRLVRIKSRGDRRMEILKRQAQRQMEREGKIELRPGQKLSLALYIRDLAQALKELYIADRKMMAQYYILEIIYQDTQNNPQLYDPEFIETVEEVMAEVEELDIEKIHRENNAVLDGYITGLDNFFRKNRLGRYKTEVPMDRREQIERAREKNRQERMKNRSPGP